MMPTSNGYPTREELEAIWRGEPLPETKMVEQKPRTLDKMAEINRLTRAMQGKGTTRPAKENDHG